MNYTDTIKKAFGVLRLDEQATISLAEDGQATGHGFLTLALTGLITGIIYSLFAMDPAIGFGVIITYPILMIFGFIIGYSIYHFLAKMFGGKATGAQYFRTLSNVMFVSILSVIPVVSYLVSIYLMVVNGFVLIKVHKLEMWKAIVVVLIPMAVIVGLMIAGGTMYFMNSAVI